MSSKESRQKKRPLKKSDFEAVLKAGTKPLREAQGEKESAKK